MPENPLNGVQGAHFQDIHPYEVERRCQSDLSGVFSQTVQIRWPPTLRPDR